MLAPPPPELDDDVISAALADGWDVSARARQYLPVGGGGYHWRVTDTRDRSLFVTADDLDTKDWLGDEREAIERGLIASLDTARLLRAHADLGFVVAPVAARDGRPILRIRDRYAISLYPYVDGRSHAFRLQTDPARRDHLLYLLIALHSVGPPTGTPHHPPAPHRRARRARGLSGGTGRAVGRGSVR